MPNSCPDEATMRGLLAGELTDDLSVTLEEHLLKCEQCITRSRSWVAQDDWLGTVKIKGLAFPESDDERLQSIIDRAKRLSSEADTVACSETLADRPLPDGLDDAALDFLRPAERDGELGRLGDYRVLDVLGSGGMGLVLRAEDPNLDRVIALKTMKPSLASNPIAKERFLREAKATAAIEHDHIVAIHQVGEENGVPFIAMPLLRGESLRERITRQQSLPIEDVVKIGREMAEGLSAAHARGLVHRDIKPANVWIDSSSGRTKILDFGLARMFDDDPDLTHSGTVIGTPRYMSPEQAAGNSIDQRSDLFGLGAVLYELLCGQPAFDGKNLTAIINAVSQAKYTPIDSVIADVDPELSELIDDLLQRDPDNRPDSADDVAARLRSIGKRLAGQGNDTQPTAPATQENTRSSARRMGLGVIVAACIIGLGWWAAGLLFRVETDNGTLVMRINSDDFETNVRGKTVVIRNSASGQQYTIDLDRPKASKSLSPGEYEFIVEGSDGLRTSTRQFSIGTRGVEEVQVWWEDPKVASGPSSGGDPLDTAALSDAERNRRAAEWILSLGGKVRIFNEHIDVTVSEQLPADDFYVSVIDLVEVTEIPEHGSTPIRGLKHLTRLDAWDSGITDQFLADLTSDGKQPPPVTSISCQRTEISDTGVRWLSSCDKLSALHVEGTKVSSLKFLEEHPSLGALNIMNCAIDPAELRLLNIASLQHLVIDGGQSLAAADAIGQMQSLEGLIVFEASNGFAPDLLTNLKQLRYLELEGGSEHEIGDRLWNAIAELPELNTLIIGADASTFLVPPTQSLESIEEFSLRKLQLNLDSLATCLDRMPNLRKLDFQSLAFTPSLIAQLETYRQLRRIDIRYCHPVSAASVEQLRTALPTCEVNVIAPNE